MQNSPTLTHAYPHAKQHIDFYFQMKYFSGENKKQKAVCSPNRYQKQ